MLILPKAVSPSQKIFWKPPVPIWTDFWKPLETWWRNPWKIVTRIGFQKPVYMDFLKLFYDWRNSSFLNPLNQ